MAQSFQCSLVTPEASVLDAAVTYAEVPAHDGLVGIMYQHAPLLVKLGPGRLRLVMEDNSEVVYFIDGGFAQMSDNHLTLLSERALLPDEIDRAEVETLREQAAGMGHTDDQQFARRQHDLAAAQQMAKIAGEAGR